MSEPLPIPPGLRLHPERIHYLTASDIGAAAGVDQHKSALDLHLEKVGLKPPPGETPMMRRGRLFEGAAIEYLRDELPGWNMLRPKVFVVDRQHRIGATPDLLVEDPDEPGVVNCQIKIVAKPVFDRWEVDSHDVKVPPLSYMLQTAMETMLLDAHCGLLACLVIGNYSDELRLFEVPRYAPAEAKVLEIAAAFWDRIERGVLPAIDYARDGERLAELYPPDPSVPTPLDLSRDNHIGELLELREQAKMAIGMHTAEVGRIDAELVDKLRGATAAVASGWRITRKMQHRGEYTVAASDYPVLRVFRTKEAAA